MSVFAIGLSDSDTPCRLIEDANGYATDTAQPLVVAYIITENEFRTRQRAYRELHQFNARYSLEQAESRAKEFARRLAADALDNTAVEYLCVGHVGVPRHVIPQLAREYESEHIFMPEVHQPWYQLLSRDLINAVSRAFSGRVTTVSAKPR